MFEGVTLTTSGVTPTCRRFGLDYWVPDPEGTDTNHGFGCRGFRHPQRIRLQELYRSFKSHRSMATRTLPRKRSTAMTTPGESIWATGATALIRAT